MKKSGNRVAGWLAPARVSAEIIVTPEAHEVAVQVLAETHDLGLEAAAQGQHELLVHGLGIRIQQALLRGADQMMAQPLWRHALDRLLEREGGGTRPHGYRVERVMQARRTHPHGRVCFAHLDWKRLVDVEEAQHA